MKSSDWISVKDRLPDLEKWKDIEGYEGFYQVSNHGRVKRVASNRCKKERILKQTVGTNGYYCVVLSKEGFTKNIFIINRHRNNQIN